MSDDQMRLQAVVVDGFTGPLKKLRDDLKATGSTSAAKDMAHDWKGVRDSIGGVTRDLNTALSPVLRGIGLTSLGVGAAVTGIMAGLKNTAAEGRNLKYLSTQLGLSADKLRELQALGEHFDIGSGQVEGSLKTLQDNLNQIVHNWGEAYNRLRGMNLGFIAEDIKKAAKEKGLGGAFETVLKDLQRIPDPVYRRQIAELLLGSDQWAVVAAEQSAKLRDKIKKEIGTVTPEELAAEERLTNSLKEMNRQISELWTHSAPLIDGFNATLNGFNNLMRLLFGGAQAREEVNKGLRRNYDLATKPRQLEDAERRLVEVERGIAEAKKSGMAGTGYAELERKQLIDEIAKLRKEIEELNKNASDPLQKSSFLSGTGMPRVIPAVYSGGMGGAASGGGVGGPGVRGPSSEEYSEDAPGAERRAPMGRIRPFLSPGEGVSGGAGAGLRGSDFLAAQRAGLKKQIDEDPLLKKQLAGMMATEGTPLESMESLANRTIATNEFRKRQGKSPLSLRQMLFSGFYGPINRGQLPGAIRQLERNPRQMKRMEDAIDAVMRGSNAVRGATDQGMLSDPNGRHIGSDGFRLRKGDNVFNDWGGGGGHAFNEAFRQRQQRAVMHDAPALADVPLPRRRPQEAGLPVPPAEPQRFEGNATLHVRFDGAPSGMRTKMDYGGMFREVKITRVNRQATQASDYVA